MIDAHALLSAMVEAVERDEDLALRLRAALGLEDKPAEMAPRLLDRQALAVALDCSIATVDRMRAEGIPELRVGDAPRFELAAVLEWMRAREGRRP